MANIKISELNELETRHRNDLLAIVDSVNNETKKIKVDDLINENVELIAVSSTAPSECSLGDKYFNTTSNKIYTAIATDTWSSTGENAIEGILYVVFGDQSTYAWDGSDLVSVGGGASGGGETLPVGTVVEFNGQASDIPSGWEAVSDKSIMVSGISQGFTTTTSGNYVKMPNQVLVSSLGTNLTFSNEAIKIGSGVSKVKVMASCQYNSTAGGFVILEIVRKRNGEEVRINFSVGTANVENTITTCMQLADVQENDEIYLKYLTANAIPISADCTKLYVEEV